MIKVRQLTVTKAWPQVTPENFERAFRKAFPNSVRTDYRNGLPDYLLPSGFVELKNYRTKKTLHQAVEAWQKHQPEQVESFKRLIKQGFRIEMLFNCEKELYNVLLSYEQDFKAEVVSLCEYRRKKLGK